MRILEGTGIEFFPYIGKIVGHPCQLRGSIEEIVDQGKQAGEKGVDGVDLLAYRYDGDVDRLMSTVISSLRVPVIVAGSINSLERVRKVSRLGAWGFTVGTAVLDRVMVPGGTLSDQIDAVLRECSNN
jgi:phosphoribosylformimino-5-aminoimidazole carboxamide ribonucleotide (ProFAR) isomerase